MTRALLPLLLWCSVAWADEPGLDDVEALLDTHVVSTASRASERADDAPATITVVTAEELQRYGLRTVHEAINFLSVGLVAQDPLHSVEVGSRGVLLSADYGNHLLLLIDGHAMNEQWNGTAYFEQGVGVPLELIDHLELIVGPGSVLYGSSAMLGVINVVTRRARDLSGGRVITEASMTPPQDVNAAPRFDQGLSGFGGSGRIAVLLGHETTLLGHTFDVTLTGEYFAHQGQSLTFGVQKDLPDEWGPRAPGPGQWGGTTTNAWWTQAPNFLLRARWGDFTLWARAANYARGSPAFDEINAAADFDTRNLERDRIFNVELSWRRTVSPRLRLMARAYLDGYDYLASAQTSSWERLGSGGDVPTGDDPANFTFRQEMRAGSRWMGLEAQGTWDWLGDGRFPLMLGVDGRTRHFHDATVAATQAGQVFDTLNQYEANEWQVAAYVQQRAQLHRTLQLNVGARLDLQSTVQARLSPRAAVVWTLPWEGRLKALVNQAFRAPSGYERFAEYESTQIRNPDLRSESVLTGELDYEQRLGRHRFFAGVFVSHFTDMIRYQAVPGNESFTSYQNLGSLLNVGGQAGLEGTVGHLTYGANFTGAVNSTDEALVASPGWFGNARLSWSFGDEKPSLSLLSAFSGERLITAAFATGPNGETWDEGTRTVPPQVELRAVLAAPVPSVKGLSLRGVVGGQLMPFSAYTVGPRQSPDPGHTVPAQMPNSRLFFMVTASWSLDPKD